MNIFDKIFVGEKLVYDIPVEEQIDQLHKLGEVRSDEERSYKQYRGQMFYMSIGRRLLLNVAAFFVGIVLIPYYLLRGCFVKKKYKLDAICRSHDYDWMEIVPDSLQKRFKLDTKHWYSKGALCPRDVPFAFCFILKYYFHPYFYLKCVYKLSKYSVLIYRHSPSAFIVHDEFSFTSSLMTLFCEKHGVKHINIQHGEKLFDLRDSFFRFHEFYIWDEHYKNLFIKLKANQGQFIIEKPLAIRFNPKDYINQASYADYKYYLGVYSEEQLVSIINSMRFAVLLGQKVKFRPHPNYSDIPLLKKHVSDEQIEFNSISIFESISNAKYVVGSDSTVLSQAYFNGINVIMDDITFKKRYDLLSELDYILVNKVHNRLSQCC